MTEKPDALAERETGYFGHHPDARIDYEIEVDDLIGRAYERLTLGGHEDLEARITKAMDFRTIDTPRELLWLSKVFRGTRELYAYRPDWMQWPEGTPA